MKKAIEETKRRREIQQKYNKDHNIIPKTIHKEIRELISNVDDKELAKIEKDKKYDILDVVNIEKIEEEMKQAAKKLDFERAMELRDILFEIKTK